MREIISYKVCAVKVRNAKLRNYLNWSCERTARHKLTEAGLHACQAAHLKVAFQL